MFEKILYPREIISSGWNDATVSSPGPSPGRPVLWRECQGQVQKRDSDRGNPQGREGQVQTRRPECSPGRRIGQTTLQSHTQISPR